MRALLSVYDKTGVVEFGRGLAALGWDLISTGGTHQALSEAGLTVLSVSEVTGSPEMMDGRVKTLHPSVHGGILARRDRPDHLAELVAHGITAIDMVVGNLYPFEATVRTPGVTDDEAIEQIDIGGPAMIRAAAKNFAGVVVITSPSDYAAVLNQLEDGDVPAPLRRRLAAKAFAHVSAYDALVAEYLGGERDSDSFEFPEEVSISGRLGQHLRYGENPHQRSAAYRRLTVQPRQFGVLDAVQLGGKELSFNNLVDTDAAWQAAWISAQPTVAIVKHAIPCGLASCETLLDAFHAAVAGDPISAFGGIVALSQIVDAETAGQIAEMFLEVVIAPAFEPAALDLLRAKSQLRVLQLDPPSPTSRSPWDIRPIAGGLLIQESDTKEDDSTTWRVPTRRQPSVTERRDLAYAWAAVRLVKSNAIVLVHDQAIIGIGSGQPNRLESVGIAVRRAGDRVSGTVLASDAFFPFPDGVEAAAAAGINAIIQPGGSIRDKRVIAAADAAEVAMIFTGTRHFRH